MPVILPFHKKKQIMFRKSMSSIAILFSYLLVMHVVAAKEKNLKIGLIGDSTVADTYGWGPALADQVNDRVTVLNYAKNGATLDSLSKRLDALIKQNPDYVLIQFGHNDMKRYDAKAYSTKLEDYIERLQRAGCKPIVLSSVTRRDFDGNGKISPRILHGDRSLPAFAQSAKAVAKKQQVPFVDLNSISIAHHNKIGPEASATYNFNPKDTTHFSNKGAKTIAALLLKQLRTSIPELTAFIQ
jgi:lysophospholipase L1-like esterase